MRAAAKGYGKEHAHRSSLRGGVKPLDGDPIAVRVLRPSPANPSSKYWIIFSEKTLLKRGFIRLSRIWKVSGRT